MKLNTCTIAQIKAIENRMKEQEEQMFEQDFFTVISLSYSTIMNILGASCSFTTEWLHKFYISCDIEWTSRLSKLESNCRI